MLIQSTKSLTRRILMYSKSESCGLHIHAHTRNIARALDFINFRIGFTESPLRGRSIEPYHLTKRKYHGPIRFWFSKVSNSELRNKNKSR